MKMKKAAGILLIGALINAGVMTGRAEPAKVEDPTGILKKSIPDKLVVLTFDDGCASFYTVAAPILKAFGFGASFYVCDFDSFKTRKDWYLTWRQMKELADQGFDIGNHTVGHGGGLNNYLMLEDEMLANGVPKPTTLAWPVFAVDWNSCPGLATNGYTFGRGGHFRPYRPTIDNPFDVPCLGAATPGEFVKNVRQATGGKIPVIIYHGVPDMEHKGVSMDPEVFKVQMQYLKDNNYKVISLRDLAEYIDPVKAAKLPRTANEYKETGPVVLADEEKPCGTVNIVKPEAVKQNVPQKKRTSRMIMSTNDLGTGAVTVDDDIMLHLEHIDATNPLILNGGEVYGGNGFGDTWNGPITLNGNTRFSAYGGFHLNNKSGSMIGPGGFTMAGGHGAFGPSNSGLLTICGANTYAGPTIVQLGTLTVKKAVSLYNGDAAQWIPSKITVFNTATLILCVGGPGEFTGQQVDSLLKNLTTGINSNGLMSGAVFGLDTSNTRETVTVSADISDSKGPGGGAFLIKKCGAGILQLSGKNTYTGQTILEGGALSVSSLNSYGRGKARPASSLGAPADIEAGEIVIGEEKKDGECALIYTGTGESSDRVMNLAGKKSTVTFDQSGTGLLKLTSTFVISGYGADKTIVLKGDTAGTGEIAGNIFNPYDRAGKAATAVTKSGAGTWVLSGINTYTGSTMVKQGTLSIASVKSLGDKTDVYISEGAMLELSFKGEVRIGKLTLEGAAQPAGTYSAANLPKFIKGKGTVRVSL